MKKELKSFRIGSIKRIERIVEKLKGMGYMYVSVHTVDWYIKNGCNFLVLDFNNQENNLGFRRYSKDFVENVIPTIIDEQEFLEYCADYIGFDLGNKIDFKSDDSRTITTLFTTSNLDIVGYLCGNKIDSGKNLTFSMFNELTYLSTSSNPKEKSEYIHLLADNKTVLVCKKK